ncbi:MAG TPA: carboxypeptidase-like regulatory domain-containing protein, partial [Gemmatimonadaceae bacterium]|nr:carboxypeptidase-like regulatory domain-containing protein [Gemmatimonadaceae bacterium]
MRHVCLIAIVLVAPATHAQSTFTGRVLSDSGLVLAGAEVVLNGPQNLQRTNASGEFRFTAVPAGQNIVGVRMPGFAPKVDTIDFADAGEVRREYRLSRIEATLPEVPVTASLLDRKLWQFHERRRLGIGRFLDSAEFANTRGTRTADKLTRLPGLIVVRGRFS